MLIPEHDNMDIKMTMSDVLSRFSPTIAEALQKSIQVYLYSAFHNTYCFKAATRREHDCITIKIRKVKANNNQNFISY